MFVDQSDDFDLNQTMPISSSMERYANSTAARGTGVFRYATSNACAGGDFELQAFQCA